MDVASWWTQQSEAPNGAFVILIAAVLVAVLLVVAMMRNTWRQSGGPTRPAYVPPVDVPTLERDDVLRTRGEWATAQVLSVTGDTVELCVESDGMCAVYSIAEHYVPTWMAMYEITSIDRPANEEAAAMCNARRERVLSQTSYVPRA